MLGIGRPIFDKSEKIALCTPRHPQGTPRGPKMPSNATWFRQHVPKCRQMRHGFDNMFQNAVKCDMVSTTSSKMLSNATWFRQHVPNLPNLPTYQPTFIFIFISCACTTLLCMHNTLVHALEGPGPKARTQQKSGRRVRPGGPGPSSACTRVLCMHKK